MANYLKRNLLGLYLFGFLKNLQFFGALAVPFFQDWGRLNYQRLFWLEAFFALSVFLLEVPTGVVADRLGRRLSLFLGGVFSASAFVLFPLTQSYPVFFAAEFLCALGFSLFSGADRALLYDTLAAHDAQDRGTKALSRYAAAENAGMVLGFPLGSLFAGAAFLPYPQGLRLAFAATAAVLLLSGFAALLLTEARIPAPPGAGEARPSFLRAGIEGVAVLFRVPALRAYCADYVLASSAAFFIYWLYQPLVSEAGLPLGANGVVAALFNLLGMLLLLAAPGLERLLGLRVLLLATGLLPGLVYLGLALGRPPAFAMAAIFLVAGAKQLRAPFLSRLMNAELEASVRAAALSGVSMLERALIMVLYPAVGFLADLGLSWAFLFLGAAATVFALLGVRGLRGRAD